MRVEDAMTPLRTMVGPEHTLTQAAQHMMRNGTGAAVVIDAKLPGPQMITERDLLRAVADGLDPQQEHVEKHMTQAVVSAAPGWPIDEAAMMMVKHGVRHVLVFDDSHLVGVLSMRDVVKNGGLEALARAVAVVGVG